MKNIIVTSFIDTFKLIKNHKYLIILLFFIQLLFFTTMVLNTLTTMTPALTATQEVLSYVNQLKLDQESFVEGILTDKPMFGDNPTLIYENYKIIIQFLRIFLIIATILFVALEGLNWAITVHLPKRKKAKIIIKYLLNFLILTLIYLLIIGFIVYNQFKSIINTPTIPTPSIILTTIITLLLLYFLMISYSLIKNNNLLEIIKKSYLLGIFKAYIIIPTIIINLIILLATSFILIKSIESSLFIVIPALILFTFSFIFTKIVFVRLIHKLD